MSEGASWSFHDPCLTTWGCADLLAWLRSGSGGEIVATTAPNEEYGLLYFTEPNVAFSIAQSEVHTLVLRVHLSLESAPPHRETDLGATLDICKYVVPITDRRSWPPDRSRRLGGRHLASYPAR